MLTADGTPYESGRSIKKVRDRARLPCADGTSSSLLAQIERRIGLSAKIVG
jgi:hypothetical protein